jgi:hypothetical protein
MARSSLFSILSNDAQFKRAPQDNKPVTDAGRKAPGAGRMASM